MADRPIKPRRKHPSKTQETIDKLIDKLEDGPPPSGTPRVEGAIYWPEGKPAPTKWKRAPGPIPCASCKAVLNQYSSQAVICVGIHDDLAYLECRVCRHQWKVAVASD